MIKSVPNQLVLVREWTKEINKRINQVKLQKHKIGKVQTKNSVRTEVVHVEIFRQDHSTKIHHLLTTSKL